MAIDTREKRQSALHAFHQLGVPFVTPNASKDQEWRQQTLWGYSGILASAPAVVLNPAMLHIFVVDTKPREFTIK